MALCARRSYAYCGPGASVFHGADAQSSSAHWHTRATRLNCVPSSRQCGTRIRLRAFRSTYPGSASRRRNGRRSRRLFTASGPSLRRGSTVINNSAYVSASAVCSRLTVCLPMVISLSRAMHSQGWISNPQWQQRAILKRRCFHQRTRSRRTHAKQ